jgi:hypothetical protein
MLKEQRPLALVTLLRLPRWPLVSNAVRELCPRWKLALLLLASPILFQESKMAMMRQARHVHHR